MPAPPRKTTRRSHRDPLPAHFESLEEAAEFWDTHDSAEYEDTMRDLKPRVKITRRRYLVPIDGDLFRRLNSIAKEKGISTETLVNLWIQERAS